MSWKVKPSATMKIPTRNEPWLTEEMKAHFAREIVPRYERKQGALMPILTDLQHRYGHIPYQAMIEIATFLDLKPGDVLDTVSFYEEYTTEPVGKYVIGVCQSIACEVCGHQAILDHIRERLDLEPHETSDDGKFTLLAMECLGACDGGPCALINEDRYDNLTVDAIDQILDRLSD
jgi:NADH:ubiquinone oxidoreductase subunit E